MLELSTLILAWYDKHARILPWRGHPDSYAVWVSEIMLQQTRVETVIPYFERWMEKFPNVSSLADATEQSVLSAWEGLGYYSRARNLQKAAKLLKTEYRGELPSEVSELRKLPGIGRYTAAAIASIAFGQDVATLDGNLRRVFSRLFDVSEPADTPVGENILWELAEKHLPPGYAGDYNQALMDLGATICLPQKPLCLLCPLNGLCKSFSLGVQDQRPVFQPKLPVPHKIKMAAVITREKAALLAQRPTNGLLGGMWEFPSAEVDADSPTALVAVIEAEYRLRVSPTALLVKIRHAYTHFTLSETAYRCELIQKPDVQNLKWVPLVELAFYPMGRVDRQIAQRLLNQETTLK